MQSVFTNRRLLLVTMHGKEVAIAPVLLNKFNINTHVARQVNTDAFGTFSGEVKRVNTQLETARQKIAEGFKMYPEFDLAISSEGAFNPHPEAPFLTLNSELLLLVDKAHDIEIAAWHHTTKTNMAATQVKTTSQLVEFANQIVFPAHKIILKARLPNVEAPLIIKGLNTLPELISEFNNLYNTLPDITIEAEVDMRAHYNPTRMQAIQECANKLAELMLSTCAKCNTPGFMVTDTLQGLPCAQCSLPTRSILAYIYSCAKCGFSQRKEYPKGRKTEDPMYCDFCNP